MVLRMFPCSHKIIVLFRRNTKIKWNETSHLLLNDILWNNYFKSNTCPICVLYLSNHVLFHVLSKSNPCPIFIPSKSDYAHSNSNQTIFFSADGVGGVGILHLQPGRRSRGRQTCGRRICGHGRGHHRRPLLLGLRPPHHLQLSHRSPLIPRMLRSLESESIFLGRGYQGVPSYWVLPRFQSSFFKVLQF